MNDYVQYILSKLKDTDTIGCQWISENVDMH